MVFFGYKIGLVYSDFFLTPLNVIEVYLKFCVDFCNLVDAGFQGPSFTWRRSNFKERLDRAFINQRWNFSFEEMGVVHLPMYNSDHSHLWIRAGFDLVQFTQLKPFKFLSAWLSHESFPDLVRSNWDCSRSWANNVSGFSKAARIWNRDVFGYIHKKKNRLFNRLHGIHRSLLNGFNPFL